MKNRKHKKKLAPRQMHQAQYPWLKAFVPIGYIKNRAHLVEPLSRSAEIGTITTFRFIAAQTIDNPDV
jgi:hypothetical protein